MSSWCARAESVLVLSALLPPHSLLPAHSLLNITDIRILYLIIGFKSAKKLDNYYWVLPTIMEDGIFDGDEWGIRT